MTVLRLLPELEDALRALPGVRAVSIVTTGDAVPTEVHVLAAPGKPAKQIVRDVQSLAMASFDRAADELADLRQDPNLAVRCRLAAETELSLARVGRQGYLAAYAHVARSRA